jgi:amino acid transporter
MAPEGMSDPTVDEQRLAELGYEQELERGWTKFTNFAISFSIISVLAGCFTVFYVGWNNGGPIVISIGWPVIALIILTVAVSMSEIASAYPTAGGPYWWAHKLGGAGWSWFTGWFNVIGLIGIVASVDYVLAFFASQLFGLWGWDWGFVNWADKQHIIQEIFWLYAVILVLHAAINIFSHKLIALFTSISVWWHVAGALIILGILIFVPDHHQSANFVFTEKINNSGFANGAVSGGTYWFLVLPVGFLLTMYTITGYDASAHVAEETVGAEQAAAKGIWQSVAISAVIGWFLLLAFLFAATNVGAVNKGFGSVIAVFTSADMNQNWAEAIIAIACVGQFFCGMACVTSCSRTFFAFSRDRAVPGHQLWSARDGGDRQLRARLPDRAAGAVRARHLRAACRILRGHRDRHDRPLHRVRDAGLSALAGRGFIRAPLLDAGGAVQVDQRGGGGLRPAHVHHPDAALLQPRCAVEGQLRLELLQLHASGRRGRPARGRARLGVRHEQALPGADSPGRVRRGHGHRRRQVERGPGRRVDARTRQLAGCGDRWRAMMERES